MVKTSPPTHHRFENYITIDLIGIHIDINDVLDCNTGIRENILIESEGQKVQIEGTVALNGVKEVKVYRNGQLVKHTLGPKVLYEKTN